MTVELRRSGDDDLPAVLDLLAVSMGNRGPDDPVEAFFRWKHLENPFGRSPAWVAVDGDRIVAFRTFMRWRFVLDGEPVAAVRAVDTATHPEYRGRGLFQALTLQALDELTQDGVGFVFNTPNDQSRPGYLKMGWQVVGRLPIAARVSGPVSAVRMLRARTPARLWSEPCTAGQAVDEVVVGGARDGGDRAGNPGGLRTDRDDAFLRWRYGFPALHYRAWAPDSGGPAVVFRVRRRGPATELAVVDSFGPGSPRVGRLLRSASADYAVGLGRTRPAVSVPVPNQGPLLTWKGLARSEMPPLGRWDLGLGDVELF